MLAPTLAAKQKWCMVLQEKANKHLISQRQPASLGVQNTLLLSLDRPHNYKVNCTLILEQGNTTWLLLGTMEGLFITPLKNRCRPFMANGLAEVFAMEILEDNLLVVITSSQREFGVVSMRGVRHAIRNDQHNPIDDQHCSVQFTSVCNISNCHIVVVSNKNVINGERSS